MTIDRILILWYDLVLVLKNANLKQKQNKIARKEMGVGKDWNSKDRVHTQFFTLTNPGSGVLSNDGTKPCSLPPVLSLLSCPALS
jgi:hypothetical protein